MQDLIISSDILEQAQITAQELRLEMACHLYEQERLSMGQARKLADMDLISFQKELAKRDIYIHYDLEDFLSDIRTLEQLDEEK